MKQTWIVIIAAGSMLFASCGPRQSDGNAVNQEAEEPEIEVVLDEAPASVTDQVPVQTAPATSPAATPAAPAGVSADQQAGSPRDQAIREVSPDAQVKPATEDSRKEPDSREEPISRTRRTEDPR